MRTFFDCEFIEDGRTIVRDVVTGSLRQESAKPGLDLADGSAHVQPEPPTCLVADLRCLMDRYGPDTVRDVVGRLDDYGRLQPEPLRPGGGIVWRHLDGTICIAGWHADTGECAEGGGLVTPRLPRNDPGVPSPSGPG
jgi:hypothetical protein